MPKHRLTANELLDADLAVLVVTAPVWITGFLALVVVGAFNDWRARAKG
jgi:hypothetical protein